jgi:hypothetical protein
MPILKSMNDRGEIVSLGECDSPVHLQIASIFLETYDWLSKASLRGKSVDVETFYILRAIQKHNDKNSDAKIEADCGYFVSDYVGEQPLREYSKVFQRYNAALSHFLECAFAFKKLK